MSDLKKPIENSHEDKIYKFFQRALVVSLNKPRTTGNKTFEKELRELMKHIEDLYIQWQQ